MNLDTCMGNVQAELDLDERDVREIGEQLRQERARSADDATFRKRAAELAEKQRIAAALKRKAAGLNILLRDEWEQDLARMRAAGLDAREAVMAKLVGSYANVTGARKSAAARRVVLEGAWIRDMGREIDAELPGVMKLLRSPKAAKPLLDDVVREWRELKPDGKPGITGNADARKLAGILAKHAEASRLEANRAGAAIGKLDGWGGPQSHDEQKLLRVKKDEWVRQTLPLLDLERSGVDAEALGIVYDNITRGKPDTARESGQRVGPANLARGLERERVLHFKDADAWIAYNDRFGRGNVFTAMLDHQRRMARTVANMQVMGPNPEVFLESVLESVRRTAPQKELARLDADLRAGTGWIGRAFREVMGHTMRPHDVSWAKIGAGVRAVQSMAKLGGAVLSSITDLAVMAHRLRYHGKGLLQSQGEALTALFSGKTKKDGRALAELLGVGFDAGLGDIHARFQAEDNLPGVMSDLQNRFFRYSGLSWWTDHLQSQFAVMASRDMAMKAKLEFDRLPPAYRRVLGIHGITAERWEKVRAAVGKADDGRQYVLPELAGEDRELELDLRSFFADEAKFAVLEGDDRTRMFVNQGTQAGSKLGEAVRFIMQFKSYPAAYAMKVLIPAMKSGRGDPGGLAMLMAMTTIYGFGAMTVKDITKNRTPKDPTEIETWLAAMIQGGGAGIYGDFLFAKRDRFGGGIGGDLLGPTIGTGIGALELWQDVTRGDAKAGEAFGLALANAPFANLWYARAAADVAFLNQLQELMAPGRTARQNKRIRDDFGQRPLADQMLFSDRF